MLTIKRPFIQIAITMIMIMVCGCFLLADEPSTNNQQNVLFSYSLVPNILMTNIVVIGEGEASDSKPLDISVMPSILSIYRPSYVD